MHEIHFLRENEDKLNSQLFSQCYQNFKGKKLFWKEINALNNKKESLPPTVGGTSRESNIANLWKDNFGSIANYVGSTDNQDQVMNALRTVTGHYDVINVHELRQIVTGLKNNKAVGND